MVSLDISGYITFLAIFSIVAMSLGAIMYKLAEKGY